MSALPSAEYWAISMLFNIHTECKFYDEALTFCWNSQVHTREYLMQLYRLRVGKVTVHFSEHRLKFCTSTELGILELWSGLVQLYMNLLDISSHLGTRWRRRTCRARNAPVAVVLSHGWRNGSGVGMRWNVARNGATMSCAYRKKDRDHARKVTRDGERRCKR